LETILLEAKDLSNADVGTLYLSDEDGNLKFEIMRTDSLKIAMGGTTGKEITFPPVRLFDSETGKENHANIASSAALTGKSINIPDAYDSKDFLVDSGNIYNKDEYVGRIHLIPKETSPGTNLYNILVTTCYQTPCNDTINHKEQEISFYD